MCSACQHGYSHPLMSHNVQSWKGTKQNLTVECANITAPNSFVNKHLLFHSSLFHVILHASHRKLFIWHSCIETLSCQKDTKLVLLSHLMFFSYYELKFCTHYSRKCNICKFIQGWLPLQLGICRLFVSNSLIFLGKTFRWEDIKTLQECETTLTSQFNSLKKL